MYLRYPGVLTLHSSFVLFLVFFRYSTSNVPDEELGGKAPRWQTALLVAGLTLLHALLIIIVTAILGSVAPGRLPVWANVLGVTAAMLTAVQYLPQIWTTFHLKHVGSLSIPMMCMQTPGGFLFAGSLFARLGWEGWSTWGIFLLTAVMQGILLCMAVGYELRARKEGPAKQAAHPERQHLYTNGFDDDTPGTYTSHPEHYAESPEQLSRIIDRQESDAAAETAPLLRPGGIGDPHRNYDTNRD